MEKAKKMNLIDICLQFSSEGMLIVDENKKISAGNERAWELLGRNAGNERLCDVIGTHDFAALEEHSEAKVSLPTGRSIKLELLPIENGSYAVRIQDETEHVRVQEELNQLRAVNQELQELFEKYDDNTLFVTDARGNILYAGSDCARNCGLTLEELYQYGTAEELERQDIFQPSVTVRVMKSHRLEAVLQKTPIGHECLSIGIPIFGKDDEMTSITAISRDISPYVRLGAMFAASRREDEHLEEIENQSVLYPDLVTASPKFLSIIEVIKLVAPIDSTVLITGQTGTGKDVVARVIHKMSERRDNKFVKVNCGAIAPNLVESELFGYEKGSFTGARREGKIGLIESANGGTLFLDEISELPLDQQVKLLQVLQEKKLTRVGGVEEIEVDVRFVSACNRDLKEEVKNKRFREDLYYRLNVIPIELPPLNDRKEDIPLLIHHFLKRFNETYNTHKEFTYDAMRAMTSYNWPGNVRELEHMVERLAVMSKNFMIGVEELPDYIRDRISYNTPAEKIPVQENKSLSEAVADFEKNLIARTMKKAKSITETSRLLGVDQSTLSRKIKKYQLERR